MTVRADEIAMTALYWPDACGGGAAGISLTLRRDGRAIAFGQATRQRLSLIADAACQVMAAAALGGMAVTFELTVRRRAAEGAAEADALRLSCAADGSLSIEMVDAAGSIVAGALLDAGCFDRFIEACDLDAVAAAGGCAISCRAEAA